MTPSASGPVSDRLTFQEAMSLAPLPDKNESGKVVKRYMSLRRAWIPGADVAAYQERHLTREIIPMTKSTAYGGSVYAQSGLAAARALADSQAGSQNGRSDKNYGIHTIHGFFSEAGRVDRPFIYEIMTVAENSSFPNLLVTVRQPTSPSTNPALDHFLPADAELPLGPVCFSALVSFRPSGLSQLDAQEPSPHVRFADILGTRPASQWPPAPFTDIAAIVKAIPTREIGTFPGLELRKVELDRWNEGRPLHERRELILYRLIAPLPADDAPLHVCAHAFEADRNGLLMVGNHAGFGFDFARAASLSYSFVVHVNSEDAVIRYSEGADAWWVQEACFPRVEAGRGIIMSKIWSPEGRHVATEYQDGIIRRNWRPGEREGKL
ncbi:Thioesterase/thiol ester dehydrase-isomerase [Xylariaceae sp. FL0016]|nr:Thioesterase/thiol ester dehydrase-isomerase [Xylariaceae sp. FL0016]